MRTRSFHARMCGCMRFVTSSSSHLQHAKRNKVRGHACVRAHTCRALRTKRFAAMRLANIHTCSKLLDTVGIKKKTAHNLSFRAGDHIRGLRSARHIHSKRAPTVRSHASFDSRAMLALFITLDIFLDVAETCAPSAKLTCPQLNSRALS